MKLYLAPGACSQADHIALNEASMTFETVKVDIPTRRMEDGGDFTKINGKGYVPALVFDDGEVLTENAAILAWVAQQRPELAPEDALGFARLIEMLSFVGSEIHKPFIRAFFPTSEEDGKVARDMIAGRLEWIAGRLNGPYLFGDRFTTADAYLFVMLRWASESGFELPATLIAYRDRIAERPAVRRTLAAEGFA